MILFFRPKNDSDPENLSNQLSHQRKQPVLLERRKQVSQEYVCDVWRTDLSLSREELVDLRQELHKSGQIDLIQIPQFLQGRTLFCFDMDSTLIQEEVIDELARFAGVYDEVASVTKEAMEGNLNFIEALRKRCTYLKDLPLSVFDDLYSKIRVNHGVPELLIGLKERNSKTAVFSGGFTDILEKFKSKYGIDEIRANYLDRKDGKLVGTVSGRVVDKNVKRDSLLELGSEFKIPKSNIVAVGDGANDQLMLEEAGLGIGFHAKEGLKSKISNWIDFAPMDVLLYLFD
ncbi:phosphoserine phosphatase SerB [Leptospira langatensis]|uniref:Phosphoserine phosphatase n=1 Tax=Leptospira langatensis TaxID=2484983 RepID=A0A5F1ZXC8_9LEPT|nr:phosphoserine phosphatase SerB [Leptospira langatensis]TGK04101.1 phosphoserine phosphatase SerB [Leptospira langatensis]TGL43581.1 phosphoserine phosphatase SerB [Leptospira langatensis]